MTGKEQCLRTPKTKNLTNIPHESTTNVIKVWKGPKSPHTFRCSDKLWKTFVSETKAQGDSVCHVMEAIIAAVLGVLRENVYKRSTVTIENLHVTRNVLRRRRVKHEYVETELVEDVGSRAKCGFCDEVPVRIGYLDVDRNLVHRLFLCDLHFKKKKQALKGSKEI